MSTFPNSGVAQKILVSNPIVMLSAHSEIKLLALFLAPTDPTSLGLRNAFPHMSSPIFLAEQFYFLLW